MPLETGTFISDLVTTNPAPNDAKSLGDDHLRLIKSTLKATLPNVAGAVTATHTELNFVTGLTAQAAAKDGSNLTTPTDGDNSTKIATTAFVANAAVRASLPGQAGSAGRFLSTDGVSAIWRQVYPTLSGTTAGKMLTNDGTSTSWVQAIPVISGGTNGKLLSNDGVNSIWTTPTPCVPIAGGGMTGNIIFANGVGICGTDTANAVHQIVNLGIDNNVNFVNGIGGHWRLYNKMFSAIILDVDNSGMVNSPAGFMLDNNAILGSKDAGGITRPLLYMAGNTVVQRIAGGATLAYYDQAGSAQLASLDSAGTFAAITVVQTSDERKKKLWQRVPHDFVSRLAGLRKSGIFRWKKGGAVSVGVGAQSLEAIFPEAVHTDEKGNKSVNYGAAAMVACVELARELEALKKLVKK